MLDHFGLDVSDYQRARPSTRRPLPTWDEPDHGAGAGSVGSATASPSSGSRSGAAATAASTWRSSGEPGEVDPSTAALAAGGKDNGGPGVREIYHPNYYGAFVLDPD